MFYIGKGSLRRAYEQRGHNRYWSAVATKHGYTVSILAKWDNDVEAFEHEKLLISCFRDLKHPLTNATNGGEGVSGWTWSESQRVKLIAALTGRPGTFRGRKHTPETLALLRQRRMGKQSPRKGVKLSEETRKAMSTSAKLHFSSEESRARQREGSKPQMRPVSAAGLVFESVHAVAAYINCPLSTVHRWVSRGWQDKLDTAVTQQRKQDACK